MASLRSRRTLRPVGFDELGLRRAISDRMLPFLVAAMAFLAGPGPGVGGQDVWTRRLSVLARSLQACAGLALLLVAAVAAAVIAVATRAGLTARREAIEIVHGLGATDGYIAARFAGRATLLAA